MVVEVVEKRKTNRVCAECSQEMGPEDTTCPNCGSSKVKKSLTIVRKAVGDEEDDLDEVLPDDEVDDDELDDDEDEDDDEVVDDDEDEDAVDDDDVKKSDVDLLGLEVLNLATAFAEDVVKSFREGKGQSGYENVMLEFNSVFDDAAEHWFRGENVTKTETVSGHSSLILERVNGIINKEGKTMADRPKNFDSLDDETKAYITSLEQKKDDEPDEEVGKVSKREDLPEDVRKSLEAADKIVEEAEVKKWDEIAKSYSHFPGDKENLAKTLRTLSESAPEAFEELKKNLDVAEEALKTSEVLKSHGLPGGGETPKDMEVSKHHAKAVELVQKGEYPTIEQAEASLMGAEDYEPTNVA